MQHPQIITPIDPKLIMRELDELDRVVHRLRTRLAVSASQGVARERTPNAWSATHGAIGAERGKILMRHLTESRRKDAQRLAALLKSSHRHR